MKLSETLTQYDTDKVHGHCYGDFYDALAESYSNPQHLLEIGVQKGGSLLAWKQYYPKCNVYGVDIVDDRLPEYISDKVNFILNDIKKFDTYLSFDIIIDDGSHFLEDVMFVVNKFAYRLRQGGVLVIEDVQAPDTWLETIESVLPEGFDISTTDLRHVNGNYDDFLITIKRL